MTDTTTKLEVVEDFERGQANFQAFGHAALVIPEIAEAVVSVISETNHNYARPHWNPDVLGQITSLRTPTRRGSSLGDLCTWVGNKAIEIDADPHSTLLQPAQLQRIELAPGRTDVPKQTSENVGPVIAIVGLEGEFSLVVEDKSGSGEYEFEPGVVAYLGRGVVRHQMIASPASRVTALIVAGNRTQT